MLNKIITLVLLTILFGCNSTQKTSINRSICDYRNGQWLQSERWAKKSIKAGKDIAKAQYMIGLCEFRRLHIDDAKKWFQKATQSSDTEVHGKATAMLGIIASNRGEIDDAEASFAIASLELHGENQLESALRSSSGTTYMLSENSFTLQFGAYRNKENANVAIDRISPSLAKAGIHSAWIADDTDRSGRTLYLVQAGHFATRKTASSVRKKNNLPQCIVTTAR